MSERVVASSGPTGPLSGLRVLDLSAVIMGPLATQILGDLGADVIVIENHRGDTNRVMGPSPHPQLSGVALNLLRNKRNVALDIKSAAGRDALLRIAATCEVFVTNVRPSGLRRARLEYADLAEVRPDVVYCEAHGFPLGGPREDDPAYDDIIQAETGVADAARRQNGVPLLAPTLMADKVSGLTIAYAILAALVQRERTGRGDHIEVPMTDTVKAWMLVEHGAAAIPVPPLGPAGYPRILTPNRKPQRTLDGWINVLPYSPVNYDAIFVAGGRDDLIDDSRFVTNRARIQNADFLYAQVAAIIGTRTTAAWLAFCRENDIPAAPVRSLDDMVEELPVTSHPHVGDYRYIPPPVRFASAPSTLRRHAPLIGADTDEVLAEVGFSPAEVADLRLSGAVPAPPPMD